MAGIARKLKCIEADIFQQLEAPANDFLANTAGLQVRKIICDDFIILANGNQIHNFNCQYFISGSDLQTQRIKLIMRDNVLDAEAAINAALTALAVENVILDIQRFDAILDNGNRYYCCCLIYQPEGGYPSAGLQVKIIEKDNILELEKASNDFMANVAIVPITVLRQEIILSNGNKIYTCTITYVPNIT